MASPAYDAKYRRHDDAPARVIPAPLLRPDAAKAELQAQTCAGELIVGDEQYEPWGTPHGGVIAELAAGCMTLQGLVALDCGESPVLVSSHHQFRRRWTRGERLRWTTRVIGRGRPFSQRSTTSENPARTDVSTCVIEVEMSMGSGIVTRSTGTVIGVVPRDASLPADTRDRERLRSAAIATADRLPAADALHLPTHHAGWSAGDIDGHFETPPASRFVAIDEAMAAAANTVRGDALGDEVAEDFLLADLSLALTGEDGPVSEYHATIRRGRSGRDGAAQARLFTGSGSERRVIALGHGRVAFLHRR